MAPISATSSSLMTLANQLITPAQLIQFKTTSTDETVSLNFTQSLLTNAAGILLRLPQDTIATALVLLQRYQVSSVQDIPTSSSFDPKIISAAVIYLTAKFSFTPLSPRSVVNVYAYLTPPDSTLATIASIQQPPAESDPKTYYVSEGTFEREKRSLFAAEAHVLAALGFDTRVVLPHALALTYIQALGVNSSKLAERTFEHLNGGLSSPQLIYLTHQPNALATAAVYLAAREVGVKLVEVNWWEVFDVDREDLGFLVLALGSLGNFAAAERQKATDKNTPTSGTG